MAPKKKARAAAAPSIKALTASHHAGAETEAMVVNASSLPSLTHEGVGAASDALESVDALVKHYVSISRIEMQRLAV